MKNFLLFIIIFLSLIPAYSQDLPVNKLKFEIYKSTIREVDIVKSYISIIANQNLPSEYREKLGKNVQKKFIDDAVIEVSNKWNKDLILDYSPSDYFTHIREYKKRVGYDNVEITWLENPTFEETEVTKINDTDYLIRGDFVQKFRGMKDEKVIYHDTTIKEFVVNFFKYYDKQDKKEKTGIKIIRINAVRTY